MLLVFQVLVIIEMIEICNTVFKELWLGLCKLENEILKEAKSAKKAQNLDQKMSFLSVFSHLQHFGF